MSARGRVVLLSSIALVVGGLTGFALLRGGGATGDGEVLLRVNGTIVYDAGGNVRMVNPDGSGDGRVLGRVGDDLYQHCPAYSPDGRTLAHLQGYPQHDLVFTPIDARGRPAGRTEQIRVFEGATLRCGKWSPDSRFVALTGVTDQGSELLLVNVAERSMRQAAALPRLPDVAWSPDSQSLAYPLEDGIVIMNVAGGEEELLTTRVPPIDLRWSPDGSVIAFTGIPPGKTQPDLFWIDGDGRNEVAVTDSDLDETRIAWSPNGSRIAVVQERCENTLPCLWQITVIDRDLDAIRVAGSSLPSVEGGEQGAYGRPLWSPDGNSILFSLLTWEEGAPAAEIPLVIAPAGGGVPRVVTEEIGIDVYDWQGLPA